MHGRSSTSNSLYADFYRDKRVLVTGGTGFVGSHVVRRLVEVGAKVCATGRPSSEVSGKAGRLRGIEGIEKKDLDLLDKGSVDNVLSGFMPEVVINTAAAVNTKQTSDILDEQIKGNFVTAVNLMEAATKYKVGKLVHIGSIAEYGDSISPFVETMREQAASPYSLGKIMATHAVMLCGRLSGMPTTVLRPAAVFGPMQDIGLMLIPNIIKSAIDGKDFDMNPGEQIRDFVYVEDLADGILAAGASSGSDQQIFNLGSNKGYKIKDIATTVNRLMGDPIQVNFGAQQYRPLDVMEFYMDSSKAKKVLGWEASTPMEVALQRTIDWYNSNTKDER